MSHLDALKLAEQYPLHYYPTLYCSPDGHWDVLIWVEDHWESATQGIVVADVELCVD